MLNLVEVVQSNSFELEVTYATAEVQKLLVGKFLENYLLAAFWVLGYQMWKLRNNTAQIAADQTRKKPILDLISMINY